jgi:uncharacterized membrane protein YphA (DoxX/SURF4 family)
MENRLIPDFEKDVLKEKLRSAKAELNQMRQQFIADLNEQTDYMKKTLLRETPPECSMGNIALAGQQMGMGPMSAVFSLVLEKGNETPSPGQIMEERTPGETYASQKAILPIKTLDLLVSYGTLAIGACLLLGLFTRLASLGGAAFLLMLYMAMPPFPWFPDPPRALEGHYLFVSKNTIEMFALLALATTSSGRWAGLDGLVGYCLDKIKKKLSLNEET